MGKQEIIDALDLAIADHQAFAGQHVDWSFVDALRAARTIVEVAPEVPVPAAIAQQASA